MFNNTFFLYLCFLYAFRWKRPNRLHGGNFCKGNRSEGYCFIQRQNPVKMDRLSYQLQKWIFQICEYKTSAKGAYKPLKLSGDSNGSYTLKSLKKGKTYYFRIRSYVKDTNSYVKAYSSYSKVLKIKAK